MTRCECTPASRQGGEGESVAVLGGVNVGKSAPWPRLRQSRGADVGMLQKEGWAQGCRTSARRHLPSRVIPRENRTRCAGLVYSVGTNQSGVPLYAMYDTRIQYTLYLLFIVIRVDFTTSTFIKVVIKYMNHTFENCFRFMYHVLMS